MPSKFELLQRWTKDGSMIWQRPYVIIDTSSLAVVSIPIIKSLVYKGTLINGKQYIIEYSYEEAGVIGFMFMRMAYDIWYKLSLTCADQDPQKYLFNFAYPLISTFIRPTNPTWLKEFIELMETIANPDIVPALKATIF